MIQKNTKLYFLICVAVVIFLCACSPSPQSILTISPNQKYRVNLQEKLEKSNSPVTNEHTIFLTITKDDQAFIYKEVLYKGDQYDDRFFYEHPNNKWVTENILWFGKNEVNPKGQHDEVRVINEADRIIRYMKVTSRDTFLILELQPKSEVLLITSPQTDKIGPASWVGCFGKFMDSEQSFQKGLNFNIEGKYVSPAQYTIRIKEQDVGIEMKSFQGY